MQQRSSDMQKAVAKREGIKHAPHPLSVGQDVLEDIPVQWAQRPHMHKETGNMHGEM